MKIELQIQGLNGVLKTLQELPPEVVSKNGGVVRGAARKGAMVLQKQARANFKAAVAMPGKTGVTKTTGFTEKNIVTIRKKTIGNVNGERFIVGVRYEAHPSGTMLEKSRSYAIRSNSKKRRATTRKTKTKNIKANDIAFMMEYGTSKQEATPWLRPAFEAKKQEAMNVAISDLKSRIDKVVAKLAKRNAGLK